jgi:dolichol-phosphate mannosyltransferase
MSYFDLRPGCVSSVIHAPLVLVMPIYNEEEGMGGVLGEWTAALEKLGINYQFILINDGSRDGTIDVLRRHEAADPKRLIVVDKQNAGHGRTCRTGYEIAVASSAEWVLQIDSDGQCDPQYMEQFWEGREQADCIFGRRVRREDGRMRTFTSRACRWGASVVCGADLIDPNVPYRMLRREVLAEALAAIPPSFNIHNVALTYVLKRNRLLRWKHVPIIFRSRKCGENSIDVARVMHWGIDMLIELRGLKKNEKRRR